jgi:hypothetical protein
MVRGDLLIYKGCDSDDRVPQTLNPPSGSLLAAESLDAQTYRVARFRRDGLSYLRFLFSQIIQTEQFGQL